MPHSRLGWRSADNGMRSLTSGMSFAVSAAAVRPATRGMVPSHHRSQTMGRTSFRPATIASTMTTSPRLPSALLRAFSPRGSLSPSQHGVRGSRGSPTEAERAGFEPANRLSTVTRFPVALLRPLGHLSAARHRVSAPGTVASSAAGEGNGAGHGPQVAPRPRHAGNPNRRSYTSTMAVCPSCGEENPNRFRLCGFCGTPLVAPLPPRRCGRSSRCVLGPEGLDERSARQLDSESLREVMTRYFEEMRAALEAHGGGSRSTSATR